MESRGIAGTRVSLRDSFFPILGWFIPSRSFPARFPTDSMRSRVISVSFPCHSVGVLFFCRLDQFLLTLIANLFARWNETVDAPPCKNMNCRRPSVFGQGRSRQYPRGRTSRDASRGRASAGPKTQLSLHSLGSVNTNTNTPQNPAVIALFEL